MKTFEFEFDDNKLKGRLFLISLLLFILLLLGILILTNLHFIFTMLLSMGFPYFVFKFFQKNIKKNGFAEIYDEKVKFKLNEIETEIYFDEIEKYFINSHNGTALSLKLKTGKRFGIISNMFFCNTFGFSKFCSHFENEILRFKGEKKITLNREKSFFEKPWIYPFMIIFTIVVLVLAGIALYKGINFKASFLGAIGSLGTAWSAYYNAKNK